MITLLILVVAISTFAQQQYEYQGRLTASYTKEKMANSLFIGEIVPDLWKHLRLPAKEYYELHQRSKTQGYYNYNTLVDFVLVTISTSNKGKKITAQSTSDKLTIEQKQILDAADLGTDIEVEVAFKYKIGVTNTDINKVVKGSLTVVALPYHEAEFSSKETFSSYLTEQVRSIIKQTGTDEKVRQTIVTFTIDEKGRVVDERIARTSTDAKVDGLLLDVIRTMPRWKPAINGKGIKVKQQFKIPFGGEGGC